MKITIRLIAAIACCPLLCQAHHSRSNFLLDEVTSFPAKVSRYEFTNPHSFVHVERTNEGGEVEEWIIELGSVPNLSRMNMGKDALKPGDQVFVRGNRDRDTDKKYMFLVSITKQDGTRYAMEDVFAGGRRARASGESAPGSKDFTGTWAIRRSTQAILAAERAPVDYDLTPAGQASMDKFDPADDPFFFCVPIGVPRIVGSPYALIIERGDNKVYFNYEFSPIHRVVHLDMDEHPTKSEAGVMGHSIGHFEGETLVIDTVNFSPETWGLLPGLDSSAKKHVVEKYSLINEGRQMTVDMTVTDPTYLNGTMQINHTWQHAPAYDVTPYVECDKEAAHKHLDIEGK